MKIKRNKKVCDKCNKEISCSNFNRHYVKCNGIITQRLIYLNSNWLQDNGKYKCPYCNNEFTKMGICSHIIFKHLELNNYNKNNLNAFNLKIKNKIIKPNKNQYVLARERGEEYSLSTESRKKMSKSKSGQSMTKQAREKISKARSKYLEEVGNGGFVNIKWYKIKNIKNEEFIVRGKWELELAKILNNENIYWIRKVYLTYIKNEITKTYCPDFYLPDYNKYIEIKGYFSQIDKEKISLVLEKNNIDLQIIFKKDLTQIMNIGIKKYWDVSPPSYKQLKG
jgi:hypothetical protein